MKIFSLGTNRYDCKFANAGRRATFYRTVANRADICPECTASTFFRGPPLVIAWEPSTDVIGDFTWPAALDDIMVTQRVKDCLEPILKGCEFHPVEMIEDKSLLRIRYLRGKRRVLLPYQGHPLWDMWVTARCSLDVNASGLIVEQECKTCNTKYYKAPGKKQRVVVDRNSWQGQNIFRPMEFLARNYVTEDIARVIKKKRFTNVTGKKLELFRKRPKAASKG